ncbi:hypothetical protein ACJO2E_12445 [Marinobacter sp. M1N3S26]|uniref:hypothetical protein n=1 Tax=Marinobacter sp. M1N3S26 TaxID=3382299 RepID=UPI00387B6030
MHLLISEVIHDWDVETLRPTLSSLSRSLDEASRAGVLTSATLWLSYNGPAPINEGAATQLLESVFNWPVNLRMSQPNLGYGGTNNLALAEMFEVSSAEAAQTAILVMNPDVLLEENTVTEALSHINADKRCGLVCPQILDWSGRATTLGHKRYPSLAVLAARLLYLLFRLPPVRSLNARYEYQDVPLDQPMDDVELCSGCFMLGPFRYWQQLEGFDTRYFMYFEDFDLAMRGRELGWKNRYIPSVRIRHAGGGGGQKHWRHQLWLIRSAFRFFNRHGWRFWRV